MTDLKRRLAAAESLLQQLVGDINDRFYNANTRSWWRLESGALVPASPPKPVEALQKKVREQDMEITKLKQENQGLRDLNKSFMAPGMLSSYDDEE